MKSVAIVIALLAVITVNASAEEFPAEAKQMLDDLGSTPALQEKNNDRVLRCKFGGTKKVAISQLENALLFSGEYNFCREEGLIRDGYFEVIVRGGEIIGKSSQRSSNGKLFDSVRAGDVKAVRELIKKKANVNYSEPISKTGGGSIEEWTPLMSAAVTGNTEMAKLLVSSGAWVNYMNSMVVNPVWLAASNGQLDVVKYLITKGAYLNNRNIDDVTPLMAAAMNGHKDVVATLIKAKAGLNFTHKDGDTALMLALANGHSEVARLLIEAGANVQIQNRFGTTALMIAVVDGNTEMVRLLVEKKARLTPKTDGGKTALDIAVAKGLTEIQEILKTAAKAAE